MREVILGIQLVSSALVIVSFLGIILMILAHLFKKPWKRFAWKLAARRVSRPVEYLCIQRSYGKREVQGWIPKESAIECGMKIPQNPDYNGTIWIDKETSEKLTKHPLWLSDEDFQRAEEKDWGSGGTR